MIGQALAGAAGLVQLSVPIFFVAPDLFQAVQMSIPPVDLDWVGMHFPLRVRHLLFREGLYLIQASAK